MKLDMKEIVKLGVILLIICFVSTALLALAKEITEPKILAQRTLAAEQSRKDVLPDAEAFEPLDGTKLKELQATDATISEVYLGMKGGDIVGYFVKALPSGYAGAVEIMTGIDGEGKIVNVKMGKNSETPGLGSRIGEPDFTAQYVGKGASGEIELIKTPGANESQVTAITGATITSRCMTKGVNSALAAVSTLKQ